MRFVFYDTETTGTNTSFDQILQFAAICTDEIFNEIDRLEIRSRLLPHIVPAPGAVKVNGITVARLHDPALPSHYQMVCAIHEKLRLWGPAVFIGYNSISFDEAIFRQALYQTLHPPYLTNTGGSCRTDVLKMVQAASVFAPDAVTIPLNEKGGSSFKLEHVAAANGFNDHNAHDALGDVEATIYLCKLLQERALPVWTSFMRFNRKTAVQALLRQEPIVSLTEFYYSRPYSWLVTAIGRNPENDGEICVVDLAQAPEDLTTMSDDDLARHVNKSPKRLRWVRSNSCPILMPAETAPPHVAARQIKPEELERRSKVYRTDRALAKRLLSAAMNTREEYDPSPHVERQIYDGFYSDDDQALMMEFHMLPWEHRYEHSNLFNDQRLKRIAHRLVFFEAPNFLPDEVRIAHSMEFASRLAGTDAAEWLTIQKAIEQADDMISPADEQEAEFLSTYRDYLVGRLHELSSILA